MATGSLLHQWHPRRNIVFHNGPDFVLDLQITRHSRSIRGFFKQYELIYVVVDERDVISLCITYRQPPKEVYLYRTRIPPAQARRVCLDYVERGME